MPGTWRKARISGFSRFVANFRNRRGVGDHPSPLVVQTGFPTSLADLYVKNSGRLRKSSPSRSTQSSSASTSASSSSSKKKPPPPPPPPRPPSPAKPPVLSSACDPLGAEPHGSGQPCEAAAGPDGANEERTELSAASPSREISASRAASPNREVPAPCGVASRAAGAREENSSIPDAEVNRRNTECPARLGFQAKIVLILILAVCTKDVVVGVMVSAILLLFFEAVGCRLFNWLRSRVDGKGNAATAPYSARDPDFSEAAVGGSLSRRMDQSATKIRSSVSLSSRLDGSWDSAVRFDELSASPLTGSERDEEFAAAGRKSAVSEGEAEPTNMKKKKKRKFWSKVVKEKFRSKCRKSKKEPPGYVFSSESLLSDTTDKGEICADRGETSAAGSLHSSDSDDDEEDGSFEDGNVNNMDQDEILRSEKSSQSMGVGISMLTDKGTVTKATSISLVLMIVVLSGLIGGRFLALALTVISCYLLKLSGSLKKQKTQ